MRGCFCAKFQPAEILPGLQQESPPQAEKRERKKAPNGQLEALKRPVYKGFLRPEQGKEGKTTEALDLGFLTVHKPKKKRLYL